MKIKTVPSSEITPEKGLRPQDYIGDMQDVPETAWEGLDEVAACCFKIAQSKGWWKGPTKNGLRKRLSVDELAAKLCLIHSEVSEALEDVRTDGDFVMLKIDPNGKPVGLPSELADIVIRVFDLCGYLNIDIADVMRAKMTYNETRPHKHGGKAL